MKTTFARLLTVAACLAACAPALLAQHATDVVRLRLAQELRDTADIERRLTDAIAMLDAAELTPSQQVRIRDNLRELVAQLRTGRAAGGKGGTAGREAPAAPTVETIEIRGEPLIVSVDSDQLVRARVLRLDDEDVGDDQEARVVRRRVFRLEGANEAPAAPKPPKPPRAPKAPAASDELPAEPGAGAIVIRQQARAEEMAREAAVADQAQAERAVARARRAEAAARAAAKRPQGRPVPKHPSREETETPAAGEPSGGADPELRAMLDEMRAEMQEIRELMQRIREQAHARPAAESTTTGDPLRR
jgi:hypothetical protein